MTNGTSSECKTLYNKLNSFVTKVINRDVQPQIDGLESDVDSLNNSITNILQYKQVATFQSDKIKVFANSFSVCITISGTFTVSANDVTTLCTIPSQYKPSNAIALPCYNGQTTHNYVGVWTGNGNLDIYNRGSGTSIHVMNIMYYPLQSRMG